MQPAKHNTIHIVRRLKVYNCLVMFRLVRSVMVYSYHVMVYSYLLKDGELWQLVHVRKP